MPSATCRDAPRKAGARAMKSRIPSLVYGFLISHGTPSWLDGTLRRRGHVTTRIMKRDRRDSHSALRVRQILAARSDADCLALKERVEDDIATTSARLGGLKADPSPLPHTTFATEAEALVGCATPARGGALLHSTVRVLKPRRVVEIGTGHGYGAVYIGSALRANGEGKLWTLEGMTVRIKLSKEALDRFGLKSFVDVVSGDFVETVPATLAAASPLDLLFADGSKDPEMTQKQFEMALHAMPQGGYMFFDDVDFSPGIRSVWQAIVDHPRIRTCVVFDSRWGLLKVGPTGGQA